MNIVSKSLIDCLGAVVAAVPKVTVCGNAEAFCGQPKLSTLRTRFRFYDRVRSFGSVASPGGVQHVIDSGMVRTGTEW